MTFGSVSQAFFDHWTLSLPVKSADVGKFPTTVSECDWRETQDMLDFQAFIATIEVRDGWPQVTATGVPLSVMIAAHHNLVTYGVPFVNLDGMWTNPGPAKTFYIPKDAIMQLAPILDKMSGGTQVTEWAQLKNASDTLDGGDVPGMAKWVWWAKMNFMDQQMTGDARVAWLKFHGFTDGWTEGDWTKWQYGKLWSAERSTQWTKKEEEAWMQEAMQRAQAWARDNKEKLGYELAQVLQQNSS